MTTWEMVVLVADHIDTVLAAAAALAGIVFSPKLWRAARSTWNATTGFFSGLSQVGEVVETVKRIDEQVGANGGRSLHDIVKMMREELATTQASVLQLSGVMRFSFDSLGTIGMFYADAQGAFTYASSLLVRWLRRPEQSLRGRGWLSAVWIDDRERVSDEWSNCIRDRRDFLMRFAMSSPQGALFNVIATASPVMTDNGPVMWVGSIRKELPGEAAFSLSRDEE